MLQKYLFIKNFSVSLDYDKLPVDEIDTLMLINSRYNEVENECVELSKTKK